MNIPYRNPANAPVDSIPEGWRLLLEEELPFKNEMTDGFFSKELAAWSFGSGQWDFGGYDGSSNTNTYITNRPLPNKYQQPPIPWYNPKNITQEQLQPELGWRFLVEGEKSGTDCEWWSFTCGGWRHVIQEATYFVSDTGERTRRPLPAQYRDPNYFSEEYQVEVFKAWRSDPELRLQLHGVNGWANCSNYTWYPKSIYRIKPADPVYRDELLTDYRVGEAVSLSDRVYVVTGTGNSHVQLDGETVGTSVSFQGLMERGAKIHRNGEWQKCFNRVEAKA